MLCSFASRNGVLTPEIARWRSRNDRLVQPRFASVLPEREPGEIDERNNPVIVAGVGRFGHIVARMLRRQR
ncbi:MAG: hypothetical protein ACR2ID_00200 [Chthoniobacterales bacterium]